MIRQVMPEFHSKDHIIILCDSWYTKQNLVSIVDEYPNLDLIGNARIDSVMYDLAPTQTGSDRMKYIPLLLYSLRWNIETSYYEQKAYRSFVLN